MKLNPFRLIEDLINEHGSSTILRERLLLIKDELGKVEKERTDLQAKVAELKKEITQLRKQLDQKSIPDQFTDYLGALFKRDSSGRYIPIAHCLKCKMPLFNIEPDIFPYECSTPGCGYRIMLHEDLTSIAEKLNKKTS
jgi:uncharacterized Zn finger protein (UPF0148 family)